MNAVRIPVPLPQLEVHVPDSRGGVDAEEVSRTHERAKRFTDEQRATNLATISSNETHAGWLHAEAQDMRIARLISARAATMRAEGTRNLVLGFGAAVIVSVGVAALFAGKARS